MGEFGCNLSPSEEEVSNITMKSVHLRLPILKPVFLNLHLSLKKPPFGFQDSSAHFRLPSKHTSVSSDNHPCTIKYFVLIIIFKKCSVTLHYFWRNMALQFS